jgi:hypothetical protein
MTTRTALTTVQLVQDGAIAEGAGTSITGLVSGGAYVMDPPGPDNVALLVNNSDSGAAHSVTVRAGGNGNTASGGSNPGVPFGAAGVGDLVTSVAASGTEFLGPFSTDRFTQADGALYVDFSSGFTGTIWVFQWPYGGIYG